MTETTIVEAHEFAAFIGIDWADERHAWALACLPVPAEPSLMICPHCQSPAVPSYGSVRPAHRRAVLEPIRAEYEGDGREVRYGPESIPMDCRHSFDPQPEW